MPIAEGEAPKYNDQETGLFTTVHQARRWSTICCLAVAAPAFAQSVTIVASGHAPYELEGRVWLLPKLDGVGRLRQRMIFALSQLFVVSADKTPYANEIRPWLVTLDRHAFGNFKALLREMTLNPAMGKYLDLGNSITPSPNENYAREVMQLFTVAPKLLNQDGFLRAMSSLGLLAAVPAQAAPSDYKALVCLYLYGGNDGNNLIVPLDAARYQRYTAVRGAACHHLHHLRLRAHPGAQLGRHRLGQSPAGHRRGGQGWLVRTPGRGRRGHAGNPGVPQ
ncbi:MAG: DUF1800 family protein [Pseudomonadota bacterium]